MLFNLISNEKINNPFLNKFSNKNLYYPFDKAVEFTNANYFTEKIDNNNYWCNDVDSFLKNYLSNKFKEFQIKPLVTTDLNFDFTIHIDNEILCLKDKIIYTLDKRIALYFNEHTEIKSEKVKFEILIKSIGLLELTFEMIISKLKNYFDLEYRYYLPVLYAELITFTKQYEPSVFEHINIAKEYVDNIKVYNLQGEFNFKKDAKGRYYQMKCSEALTGRLNQMSKNSLQTLPKERRNLLVAEPNCFLLEYDFKAFEYNILLDLYGLEKPEDPHLEMIKYLGIDVSRDIGKKINYAFLYGMNAEKIKDTIYSETGVNIDIEKLTSHPLFRKDFEIPLKEGIIYTYFKRPIKIEKEWALLNNFIQGTATDIFFFKFNEIAKLLSFDDTNKILLQKHDSILIQLHKDLIKQTNLAQNILSVLKKPIDIFSFEVDFKYGKVWGELT